MGIDMSEEIKPHTRFRVNVSQSVKGIHTVEHTVELVIAGGVAPDIEKFANNILTTIKAVEQKLIDDGRAVARNEHHD